MWQRSHVAALKLSPVDDNCSGCILVINLVGEMILSIQDKMFNTVYDIEHWEENVTKTNKWIGIGYALTHSSLGDLNEIWFKYLW